MAKNSNLEVEVTEGNDNVFADLGLPEPAIALFKAQLYYKVCQHIQKANVKPHEIARILGIDTSKVSQLSENFASMNVTTDQLLLALLACGQDIYVNTKVGRGKSSARITVLGS